MSESQIGINTVINYDGGDAGKVMMLDGERSEIGDYESDIQMRHQNIFMPRHYRMATAAT